MEGRAVLSRASDAARQGPVAHLGGARRGRAVGRRVVGYSSLARRARDFIAAGVDPRSHTGLGLTLRLAGFALAVWVFSDLLDAVLDNATIARLDRIVESWFHIHSTPAGLEAFDVVT